MLSELCRELRNYFDRDLPKFHGILEIRDGRIVEDGFNEAVQDGQYFYIVGSVFNDGVYKHPYSDLTDEIFTGSIGLMAVPKEVIDLSDEIDQWTAKYNSVESEAMSPYSSESFGGYSYVKASGSAGGGGGTGASWQDAFASRLKNWRKI